MMGTSTNWDNFGYHGLVSHIWCVYCTVLIHFDRINFGQLFQISGSSGSLFGKFVFMVNCLIVVHCILLLLFNVFFQICQVML